MMTLGDWIKKFPRNERRGQRQKVADACGVTEQAVRHWCNGNRGIAPHYYPAIEKVTGGKVKPIALIREAVRTAEELAA